MGYVDGRSPRAGVEMRKKRLLEWGAKKRESGNAEDDEGRGKQKSRL
tara:strand:- start:546 stop:686 length:141 start_codon:yes stop_codon:yes gene_type:complete